MSPFLQKILGYGRTALEQSPGELSAMRVVQVPLSYLIVLPVVFVWTYLSLRHGAPAVFDHWTIAGFVGLVSVLAGCKAVQCFGES